MAECFSLTGIRELLQSAPAHFHKFASPGYLCQCPAFQRIGQLFNRQASVVFVPVIFSRVKQDFLFFRIGQLLQGQPAHLGAGVLPGHADQNDPVFGISAMGEYLIITGPLRNSRHGLQFFQAKQQACRPGNDDQDRKEERRKEESRKETKDPQELHQRSDCNSGKRRFFEPDRKQLRRAVITEIVRKSFSCQDIKQSDDKNKQDQCSDQFRLQQGINQAEGQAGCCRQQKDTCPETCPA